MVSPELVAKALATIGSSPANREYFFANLHSPDWLEPLRAAGRFRSPIHAVPDERGIAFLPWPESAYLARMAAEKPELLRDIILESQEPRTSRATTESSTQVASRASSLWLSRRACPASVHSPASHRVRFPSHSSIANFSMSAGIARPGPSNASWCLQFPAYASACWPPSSRRISSSAPRNP